MECLVVGSWHALPMNATYCREEFFPPHRHLIKYVGNLLGNCQVYHTFHIKQQEVKGKMKDTQSVLMDEMGKCHHGLSKTVLGTLARGNGLYFCTLGPDNKVVRDTDNGWLTWRTLVLLDLLEYMLKSLRKLGESHTNWSRSLPLHFILLPENSSSPSP